MSVPEPVPSPAVSVVGLGKLGSCIAAAFALRGKRVVGVDTRPELVEALNRGQAPVPEPGLAEAVLAARPRLSATLAIEPAVLAAGVTFVVVPTPSLASGAFSLEVVRPVFSEIGRALGKGQDWHLVVLTSTVLPGQTRHVLIPELEAASGKRCGRDFGVCYSPAFIALGSVLRDFLNPDFILVGESDARAGEALEALYREVLENAPPIRRMSLENAELAKIGVNTFVTTKIAFANMLADLCERLPGGDVDAVTDALGLDRRIGRRYLTGGLGYGGPCFPRDNQALSFLARALGTRAPLAEATDLANQELPERAVERMREAAVGGRGVAVLGLAYKPGTSVTEGSQGVWLARTLAQAGARVWAYDPLVGDDGSRLELEPEVTLARTLPQALQEAELILVCTPDPAFRGLPTAAFDGQPRPLTVVDFWRLLEEELAGHPWVRYLPAGRPADGREAGERLARLWSEVAEAPAAPPGPEIRRDREPPQQEAGASL